MQNRNLTINGYREPSWGVTYKVYLPKDPRYTRKQRPRANLVVSNVFVDTSFNRFFYCFAIYYDADKNPRYDYDNCLVDDPNSFYHFLKTNLGAKMGLSNATLRRFESAGMCSLDGLISYKPANCFVEIVAPEQVSVGLISEEILEAMEMPELIKITSDILAVKNKTGKESNTFYGLSLPSDETNAKEFLHNFVRKNKHVIGAGRGMVLPEKLVYIYDSVKPRTVNFDQVIIFKSDSGTFYLTQLYRNVNTKVLKGLLTLSKRTNRDYPKILPAPKSSAVTRKWLDDNGFDELVDSDTIPPGLKAVYVEEGTDGETSEEETTRGLKGSFR